MYALPCFVQHCDKFIYLDPEPGIDNTGIRFYYTTAFFDTLVRFYGDRFQLFRDRRPEILSIRYLFNITRRSANDEILSCLAMKESAFLITERPCLARSGVQGQ